MILDTAKGIIKKALWPYIRNGRLAMPFLSTESALFRIRNRGLSIGTVVDVGASDGRWSASTMKFFPDAYYFLIEAKMAHQPGLEKFVAKNSKANYLISAAGNKSGVTYFDARDLFGGTPSEKAFDDQSIRVPMITIDQVVAEHSLAGPFMLKLDTHGFEVPILEGATQSLQETNLIILETYNFDLADGSLRFPQMCTFMEELGFRCIDISEPLFRPKDHALWQFDLFFVRSDRPEFDSNSYA